MGLDLYGSRLNRAESIICFNERLEGPGLHRRRNILQPRGPHLINHFDMRTPTDVFGRGKFALFVESVLVTIELQMFSK